MKSLIRRILREETEPDFAEKVLTAIQNIGRRMHPTIKRNLKWLIKNVVGHTPTKARLIFPSKGWETVAVEILESLGIVTGTYKSVGQAINFFKELKNNGVILEELMIGSHGSPGNLLVTRKYAGFSFKEDFLKHIKPVVNSQTKVYFTACKGADKLGTLKDAADYLGCECYACMGDNAFSFGCAESNWSCNANTGVPTFKNQPDSWDEISVMTGVELDQEKELGPPSEWKYDRKSNIERRDKIMAKHKMWDMEIAKMYQQYGVCQEQPNLPFNWLTLGD